MKKQMEKQMKRLAALILVSVMVCTLAACGSTTVSDGRKTVSVNTVEELEQMVETDVENTIATLQNEYENLLAGIDTYDAYMEQVDEVEVFYAEICRENRDICIRMRQYSIAYAELVCEGEGTRGEKYDAIDDLYDCIYDDACGEIYDGIYDDLLGDIHDALYDGILRDAYDTVPYGEWSDAMSEAYEMWSDCLSDVYEDWADALKDIYRFWSDICGALWDGDMDEAGEEIEKFREEVKMLTTGQTQSSSHSVV